MRRSTIACVSFDRQRRTAGARSGQVRVRPLNKIELDLGNEEIWKVDTDDKSIQDLQKMQKYHYDSTFGPDSNNQNIYDGVGCKITENVFQGRNGTLFAYGQTSAGKTHTLMGSPEEPGLMILAVSDLFAMCEAKADHEFLARMSYVEIYNEEVKDLLDESGSVSGGLAVVEDPKTGPYVKGAIDKVVLRADDALQVLYEGEKNRHFAATAMNNHSSRSHVVLVLVLETRKRVPGITRRETDNTFQGQKGGGAVKISRLNLVDLAGSEKVAKAGTTGQRLVEGTNINKSLMTLGMVIMALAKESKTGKHEHIPYRDSKLTRLLSSSLGGNACTAVVCACSPAERNYEETCGTLKFATFSASIINKVSVNVVGDSAAVLGNMKSEIEELRAQLANGGAQAEKKLQSMLKVIIKAKETGLLERSATFAARFADMTISIAQGSAPATIAEGDETDADGAAERKESDIAKDLEALSEEFIHEIEAEVERRLEEDPNFFDAEARPLRTGKRRMSTMGMHNLARISQLRDALISEDERVQLGLQMSSQSEAVETLTAQVEELKNELTLAKGEIDLAHVSLQDAASKAKALDEHLAEERARSQRALADKAEQLRAAEGKLIEARTSQQRTAAELAKATADAARLQVEGPL
jgi:centromeric protein E